MRMILDEIISHKKMELAAGLKDRPFAQVKEEALSRGFRDPIFARALESAQGMAVIAEIKKKSPSKGILREDFDPVVIAGQYEKGGATALSVLTDEKFFAGSTDILKAVRAATKLPILRKDFTIDEYQIYDAKAMGADAVLLIAGILSGSVLLKFRDLAQSLGLDALIEIHDEAELAKVLPLEPRLLGINNRDLKTFKVDLSITTRLMRKIPKNGPLVVSESGISSFRDLDLLSLQGVKAVLVGESLIKEMDPGAALRKLVGTDPRMGTPRPNTGTPRPNPGRPKGR